MDEVTIAYTNVGHLQMSTWRDVNLSALGTAGILYRRASFKARPLLNVPSSAFYLFVFLWSSRRHGRPVFPIAEPREASASSPALSTLANQAAREQAYNRDTERM